MDLMSLGIRYECKCGNLLSVYAFQNSSLMIQFNPCTACYEDAHKDGEKLKEDLIKEKG